ncbi:MAG: hypothetical protein HC831_27285 [Chloroflexia bacterium]|nr:hypothetical protein [Chloroflexia bacterium]
MGIKTKYLLLIFFAFVSIGLFGQESKVRLAYQYYQNNEYEKAAVLFEELYNENKASVYFTYTINCLIEIENYDKAEKLIKKQIRREKGNVLNFIELGYLYKVKKNLPEAEKQYLYVIKNLPVEKNAIIRIANSFLSKREFEYVNQTYEKGRKLIPYQFHLELANSYAYQRKSQQMVDEYLDLLREDPGKQTIVQTSLQSKMVGTFDEDLKEIIKRTLIKRIQKEPRVYVYNELLIWYYIQEENFGSAIIQAKALDKRRHEGGLRLIELGELALQNNEFENARDAFEYVLKNGNLSPFMLRPSWDIWTFYISRLNWGK